MRSDVSCSRLYVFVLGLVLCKLSDSLGKLAEGLASCSFAIGLVTISANMSLKYMILISVSQDCLKKRYVF